MVVAAIISEMASLARWSIHAHQNRRRVEPVALLLFGLSMAFVIVLASLWGHFSCVTAGAGCGARRVAIVSRAAPLSSTAME